MSHNIEQIYHYLHNFDFASLFVRELHWFPPVSRKTVLIDDQHSRHEIARYIGVSVFEVTAGGGSIPNAHVRDRLHQEISSIFPRSLFVFVDGNRTQSVWHWVKREGARAYRREYFYAKGQPEDLFLHKLTAIIADIIPADEQRGGKGAFNVRNRSFAGKLYQEFEAHRRQFSECIEGIDKEQDRDLYTSILLSRLIFLYFLQRRGFIDGGNTAYLEDALRRSSQDCYYRAFLLPLFFEGLSKPVENRSEEIRALLGKIIYLGVGLFQPHSIERQCTDIRIPDTAFEKLFSFFSQYTWQIVDIPSDEDNEITPDMLGYIFEMYFNGVSGIGLSYTPPEIPEYLCRQTIHQVILEKVRRHASNARQDSFDSIEELLAKLDVRLCRQLLFEVLPSLSVLDPACGSGAFLVAAMNTLVTIYCEVIAGIASLDDDFLSRWLHDLRFNHPGFLYYFKKSIIINNLFGVDIREDAIEITRLRVFLALIASSRTTDELEPLPDIGFHISTGNSLVGLLRANEAGDVNLLRDTSGNNWTEVIAQLNRILLTQLYQDDRRYQQRRLNIEDIEKLAPFHWGYEFPQIMNERGGFDVIITNPPWEVLRPGSEEASEAGQSLVLQLSPQYEYQNPVVNGRTQRTDVNLYKLFVEQSYNLLRNGGYCGIVVPHGICSDQSTKRLRELLFNKTRIAGLFCFENRKKVFGGLDSRFKFALLTFEKGERTEEFPAAFAKQDVEALDQIPAEGSIHLSTDFVRRFSPDTLSIGEFRNQTDIRICEKMLQFPLLGKKLDDTWNIKFSSGLYMGSPNHLDTVQTDPDALPICEGRMIHQFTHTFAPPRYWINKQKRALFSRQLDEQQKSGYRGYRLGFRDIASGSNERTLIATVLPPHVLMSNTISFTSGPLDADLLLFLTAIFNSFMIDFFVRLRVSLHVTISSIYQLPVPRLTREDNRFFALVKRASRLICTTQEFKELWETAISESWSSEVHATSFAERNRLRAELDGLIAHLYNVTEEEFTYILSTFPLVADPVKVAAQNAYRDVERGLIV